MADIEKTDVSAARKWLDRLSVPDQMKVKALVHVEEGALALRQGGESLISGALLGAIAAQRKGGLDAGKVPIDGVIGILGLGGGVAMAGSGYAPELRNLGATSLGVLSYRKTLDYFATKGGTTGAASAETGKGKPGAKGKVHGDDIGAEDEISRAAAAL